MNISVVIPTLNEEEHVAKTIRSAQADGATEVIVVDGGSTDRTVETAAELTRVISAPRGRAQQMNHGAREANGEIILFLHADTQLPPGSLPAIVRAVKDGFCAGCFRLKFEPSSLLLGICGRLTILPFKSLCFGDRGLFVVRSVFESTGGFDDIPIFEDLEIVRRLHRMGRFAQLSERLCTSSRRFMEHGTLRQQVKNVVLWSGYHIGVSPARLARYYRYAE